MQKITLHLDVEDINTILTALGQQPYVQVHALITTIQQQSYPQLQELQVKQEQSKQ